MMVMKLAQINVSHVPFRKEKKKGIINYSFFFLSMPFLHASLNAPILSIFAFKKYLI